VGGTVNESAVGAARTQPSVPAQDLLGLLRSAHTVAVVGVSANPARASHSVAAYLLSRSPYEVYFVNPTVGEILGRRVYPSLGALPVVPDLVDVFRRYDALPAVLDETLAVGASTLWLQLGLWHDEVARRAESRGLSVVMDRCLKTELARLRP
jgi:predicted CoA-binding protein